MLKTEIEITHLQMIVGYADGKAISIRTIVAIVVPTVVILVLAVGFLVSRRRKLYQTVEVQGWLVLLEVNQIQMLDKFWMLKNMFFTFFVQLVMRSQHYTRCNSILRRSKLQLISFRTVT